MRLLTLVGGIGLLATMPGAVAEDAAYVLYFQSDGTLGPSPGGPGRTGREYAAAPADEAYTLRPGSVVSARMTGLLDGGMSATLSKNDQVIGRAAVSGALLRLLGDRVTLVFDNPETTLAKGDVLSVRVDASPGLLGTGLLGSASPHSLAMRRAPLPAPPPPVATTPAAPTAPAPTPAAPPSATPQAPIVVPIFPVLIPTQGPGAEDAERPEGDADAGASRATPPAWLAGIRMPWESASGALLLLLVAATTLGGWSLVRLGRI